MFTGIVEEVGSVKGASLNRLAINACKVLEGTRVGDSIAVNGVCLTVTSLDKNSFDVDIMPETLRCSNLGKLHYGDSVNLERALALGGRLGGHLVLGHVEATGEIVEIRPEETARLVKISAPVVIMPYVVNKGFIAVDGVSLTVVSRDNLSFAVSLVSYTLEHTTLGNRRAGDMVNLESDIIAKYVEGLREGRRQDLTLEVLEEYGFAEEN
jgi:riboflavin synthase